MISYIRRPRQVIGLIYMLMYIIIFITFAIFQREDQSWSIDIKLTAIVMLWFILSLSVKVSMFMNRILELLNLSAFVTYMSIGFIYRPQPGPSTSIENFCYYLYFMGGPVCDLFDFFIQGGASRPEDTV